MTNPWPVPDSALWPSVPYGYCFSTRTQRVDGELEITVSLLQGEPLEVGRALIEASRRGEFPACRIAHGTTGVVGDSGAAVLELMRDLKARAGLT